MWFCYRYKARYDCRIWGRKIADVIAIYSTKVNTAVRVIYEKSSADVDDE